MTTKTKKIIMLATASVMALTATLAIPTKGNNALAEVIEYPNIIIEGVYDGYKGLTVYFEEDRDQGRFVYPYTMPFVPWVPVSASVDSASEMQDASYWAHYEDISGNATLTYSCGYDEPTFEDDGGIIDDGIPYIYPNYSFSNVDEPSQLACGLRFDGYWVCDVSSFDSLPIEFLVTGSYPAYHSLTFSVYTIDGEWFDVSYYTREYGDYFHIYPHLPSNAKTVTSDGSTFYLIRDYNYTVNAHPDVTELSIYCECAPYVLTEGAYVPSLSEFTVTITNEAPPPVDVGAILWQPVESFLETEFLPSFTFGDMCMLALGLLLFGVFLKTFLGG